MNTYCELADVSFLAAHELVCVMWAVYFVSLWLINNDIKNKVVGVSVHTGQGYTVSYIYTDKRFFVLYVDGPYFVWLLAAIISCNFL